MLIEWGAELAIEAKNMVGRMGLDPTTSCA